MSNSNEINWDELVWKEINDAVRKEVSKIRTAQKVFPTTVYDTNPTEVPNDVINFEGDNLTIQEGRTKSFVEIYQPFTLTSAQVSKEADLKTCKTLARMAAKVVALAEDAYIFQRSDRDPTRCRPPYAPEGVTFENLRFDRDPGLLAEANPTELGHKPDDQNIQRVTEPIVIQNPQEWGLRTFGAVTTGIAHLVAKGQAPDYALFLPTNVYAGTFDPLNAGSLATTADRIKPLVEGGFYSSGVLPATDVTEGLLVALAGEPIKLYVGQEAVTEFVHKDGARYHFRVVERIQYIVRDPRALVLLQFTT